MSESGVAPVACHHQTGKKCSLEWRLSGVLSMPITDRTWPTAAEPERHVDPSPSARVGPWARPELVAQI